MSVVQVSFVIIAEYFVGCADGFESDLGLSSFVLGDFVGVTR